MISDDLDKIDIIPSGDEIGAKLQPIAKSRPEGRRVKRGRHHRSLRRRRNCRRSLFRNRSHRFPSRD
jgi:hypothetical protein